MEQGKIFFRDAEKYFYAGGRAEKHTLVPCGLAGIIGTGG